MDMIARKKRLMMQTVAPQQIEWNGADFVWTVGYNIGQTNNGTAGIAGASVYYKAVLDFVPCSDLAGRTVSISHSGSISNVMVICAFYAEDNESSYIDGSAINNLHLVKNVPSNARFCRFAIGKNHSVNDFYLRTI